MEGNLEEESMVLGCDIPGKKIPDPDQQRSSELYKSYSFRAYMSRHTAVCNAYRSFYSLMQFPPLRASNLLTV